MAIVAIDADDQVLLVRQYRSPADAVLLEIPAGTLDVDPATGRTEDPDLAARRELEEETGYRAGSLRLLTRFWTAPGFATELMHLYLATDLSPADADGRLGPDEDEHLRLERRLFAAAVAAARNGEIADAKSLVGLLWVDRERSSPAPLEPRPPAALIEKSYVLTLGELLGTSAAAMRRSRFAQIFGVVMAGLAVPPVLAGEIEVALPGIILAVAFLTGLFTVPFTLFVAWRYRDRVFQTTTVSISEAGVHWRAANADTELAWAIFSRLRESSSTLWLEFGPQTLPIPIRIFTPAELATIRRLAAEAGFGPDGRPRGRPGRGQKTKPGSGSGR